MITRNQLFTWYVDEMKGTLPIRAIEYIFKSFSDDDLMAIYGLKSLGKGRFYR
jgi:hypothetical protein